ncbi:hypothetical protein U0X36_05505 [Bacillus thuringiensis]|uniref:hypothetical protein n=1 Tax=Bacillus thuringiensis TaxID=1428 RepID=UPI000E481A71|nr:hypothetical protein [Bacillus thuringiensis]MDZ3952400.1 hypothetical protein [Bacillus thuringiensis]RGP45224.1 hypothetical protein BTW32_26020 [Bacillus thuringiensis]
MIKTLLAGTLLSTGLLAGGALGAEEVNTDKTNTNENEKIHQVSPTTPGEKPDTSKPIAIQKNENGSISVKKLDENELPEGVKAQATQPSEDAQSKYGETIEMPEGTDSKPMKESTEGEASGKGKVKVVDADKDENITYKEIDESEIPKDAVPA